MFHITGVLGMNSGDLFRKFKEKIIKFKYKIGTKLIGVEYDLQESF